MKTIIALFAITIACISTTSANAQSNKSERTIGIKTRTIQVNGECGMCKKKIEKAAYSVDGIQFAKWDEDTKTLTIKYSVFNKDAAEKVQKKIASVGYDTEKFKAGDEAYKALPDCCRYQRKQA